MKPTLEEVKLFLRFDGSDENGLVASLILTAKELVKAVLRKPLTSFVAIPAIACFAFFSVAMSVVGIAKTRGKSKMLNGIKLLAFQHR